MPLPPSSQHRGSGDYRSHRQRHFRALMVFFVVGVTMLLLSMIGTFIHFAHPDNRPFTPSFRGLSYVHPEGGGDSAKRKAAMAGSSKQSLPEGQGSSTSNGSGGLNNEQPPINLHEPQADLRTPQKQDVRELDHIPPRRRRMEWGDEGPKPRDLALPKPLPSSYDDDQDEEEDGRGLMDINDSDGDDQIGGEEEEDMMMWRPPAASKTYTIRSQGGSGDTASGDRGGSFNEKQALGAAVYPDDDQGYDKDDELVEQEKGEDEGETEEPLRWLSPVPWDNEESPVNDVLAMLHGNATLDALDDLRGSLVGNQLTKKLWTLLEHQFSEDHFTFFEWAGSSPTFLSMKLAEKYPDSTIISARTTTADLPVADKIRSNFRLLNLLFISATPFDPSLLQSSLLQPPPTSESSSTTSSTAPLHDVCDYQLIWDLTSLVGTRLPHEFEEDLGIAMKACGTTFLPSKLPPTRFFSYWESMSDLINAAARKADIRIYEKELEDYTTWKSRSYYARASNSGAAKSLYGPDVMRVDNGIDRKSTTSSSSSSSSTSSGKYSSTWWPSSSSSSTPSPSSTSSPKSSGDSSSPDWSSSSSTSSSSTSSSSSSKWSSTSTGYASTPAPTAGPSAPRGISLHTLSLLNLWYIDRCHFTIQLFRFMHLEAYYQGIKNLMTTSSQDLLFIGGKIVLTDSTATARATTSHKFSSVSSHRGQPSSSVGGYDGTAGLDDAHGMYQPARRHRRLQAAGADAPVVPPSIMTPRTAIDDWLEEMGKPSGLWIPGEQEEEQDGGHERKKDTMGRHAQETMAEEQGGALEEWSSALHTELPPGGGGTLLLYGGDLGLFSLKLSNIYPTSLVFLMTPTVGLASAHTELATLLQLPNSLVGVGDLTPNIISSLSQFTHHILSAEALKSLLVQAVADGVTRCNLILFENMLGRLLASSPTSFIEFPTLDMWLRALDLFLPSCADSFRSRYLSRPPSNQDLPELQILTATLASAGIPEADIKVIRSTSHSSSTYLLLRVDLKPPKPSLPSSSLSGGLPLHFLLNLGLGDSDRARMAQLFLRMPLWQLPLPHPPADATAIIYYGSVPSNLPVSSYYGLQLLREQNTKTKTGLLVWDILGLEGGMRGLGAAEEEQVMEAEESDGLWRVLGREMASHPAELEQGAFSMMELGSGRGFLSLQVAKAFPKATVISVESSKAKTAAHYRMLQHHGLWNNVVCNTTEDLIGAVATNLYESPELVRFLFFRPDVLSLLAKGDPEALGKSLGMITSSGVTTFLRMPTAQHVSLAMALFGPHLYNNHNHQPSFPYSLDLASHPLPYFRNFETRLIHDALVVPKGYTRITAGVMAATENQDSLRFPMVRVDIANMTRHVHHHFDYRKDGHTRTYTMHVVVNTTSTELAQGVMGSDPGLSTRKYDPPGVLSAQEDPQKSLELGLGQHVAWGRVVEVYLNRDTDGQFIPYTTLHGVTLIAAMRLGLLPALRQRAYDRFLSLPLYEDMAPWNIVFRGDGLDYIDYDTRDKTFDAVIPQAYQVLSVLMNYKRTVQDFENCSKDKARTPYGFPYISDCVDSTAFRGPCTDPTKPVPCGDGQCRSDYIDCLRSLLRNGPSAAVEMKEEEDHKPEVVGVKSGGDDGEGNEGVMEMGFDSNGVLP